MARIMRSVTAPPHDSETVESPMASGVDSPEASTGWNSS